MSALEQALSTLATQGVLGLFCVILMVALYRKDAALQELSRDRTEDAKKFGEILADLSKATAVHTQTLQGLATLIQNFSMKGRS